MKKKPQPPVPVPYGTRTGQVLGYRSPMRVPYGTGTGGWGFFFIHYYPSALLNSSRSRTGQQQTWGLAGPRTVGTRTGSHMAGRRRLIFLLSVLKYGRKNFFSAKKIMCAGLLSPTLCVSRSLEEKIVN